MGNPYPIRIQGSDGIATLNGEATFTDPANQPGGGGSQPLLRLSFPFSFDDAGLADGIAVPGWTPAPYDEILRAEMLITTAWDGATPKGDLYLGATATVGLFGTLSAHADMTVADDPAFYATANLTYVNASFPNPTGYTVNASDGSPLVVVSQDGSKGGASPAAMQGTAILRLLILLAA